MLKRPHISSVTEGIQPENPVREMIPFGSYSFALFEFPFLGSLPGVSYEVGHQSVLSVS